MSLRCVIALMVGGVVAELQLGTGIYDSTPPITDINFMGMSNPSQTGAGLHQRLRSRAFVSHDTTSGKRFAFVSADFGMGGIVLTNRVVTALEKALGKGLYTADNVVISGTHTHSGPSGFLQNTIFQFAGSGWIPAVLDAMVEGTTKSILMAHARLTPGKASIAVGLLAGANINRSPTSYLLNPPSERAANEIWGGNTDHNMTVLKLVASNGTELGMFNWFAVHGTSMNNTNLLVSGDNKGYASYLFERAKNGPTNVTRTGRGPFVAAFAATNLGDVSPNTAGPRCRDTGLPCDTNTSTCQGRTEQCSAFGPGRDMFESCAIIGRKQHEKALELYHGPTAPLEDTVDYVHTYVKMPGLNVTDSATGAPLGTLCKAAMGDSFAAGTTDGPGMFDFTQGSNTTNPFWNILVDFLHKATPEEKACQHPKGILLPTGSLNTPWPWAPSTLPFSLLRLGGFAIIVVPSELTTMAGRRLRNAVRERMIAKGLMGAEGHVVIAGLSNAYADYTTTFEEYQAQRYEAGSTIFGPHQLQAYIQTMLGLVDSMAAGTTPAKDPPPEDFSHKCVNEFQKGKLHTDYLPRGAKHFGDVLREPQPSYKPGEVAVVSFAGANPTNNLRPQGTFLEVQLQSGSNWVTVADDGDWETRISIEKTRVDLVEHARTWHMSWYIPADAVPGTYRIQHFGTSYDDPLIGKATKTEYTGTSATFTVAAA